MKSIIFGAGSDLGVHIDGAHLGPVQLINDLQSFYKGEAQSFTQDENIIKSRNLSDRRKNEYEVDKFNTVLYNAMVEKIKQDYFPILLGGDHSVVVASALASLKVHGDLGIIWIDAHTDYNTFETTITGNIHGLPLAAINGYKCPELRTFHDGNIIQPVKTVVVGARSIDKAELENIKYSGITVFTTEDIKEQGVEAIMDQAYAIAGRKTMGIHISYDLDVIDPDVAPGVSVPELDGISEEEAMQISAYISNHMKEVVSFDLVEFNPLRDINRKTEQIAINILAQVTTAINKKSEYDNKIIY